MRCYVVIYGGGTCLVASSLKTPTDPILVNRLRANDIARMMLMEVPEDLCRQRYGETFERVSRIMGKDEFHVLDFNGASVFAKFSFSEMGPPVMVEF